jgi:hypothetical protein
MKTKTLDIVREYLETEPRARERKNRARVVWNLLEKLEKVLNRNQTIESMSKDFFINHFSKIQSLNRSVNRIQQLYPELRGTDYEDKEVLEQEAQLEQGYTPGFNQDIKKLNTL